MKRRILFVDDEPNILSGLRRILHGQKDVWDMNFASNVDDALKIVETEPPDAIVTDVNMPGKTGLDLLAELKADPATQEIEVVMLTGLREQDLKRRALELGATDLLNKPVDKDDLVARLESVLRMRSYRETLHERNEMLQEELVRSQKMELVGMLSAGVTHDVNSILATIMCISELAINALGEDSPAAQDLKKIEDACEHAARISEQVLKLTRSATESRELCELGEVVDVSLELLRASMPAGIRVRWDGAKAVHQVSADSTQMSQMLMNLCLNAVESMGQKGILRISLDGVSLDEASLPPDLGLCPGHYAKLVVSDTGKGIDEDVLQHIFDPLYTTKGQAGGTGLGLSVVQWIVKNHGGFIDVESGEGAGTRFTVYLPCVEGDSE